MKVVLGRAENIVGKKKNAEMMVISIASFFHNVLYSIKDILATFDMFSALAFNFDENKILCSND